jgi:colanic acid biosynthesis glycosyl transferase WcaI
MRILILGLNYTPEKIGIAVYTSGLALSLKAAGHDVRVISAKPYYPDWKVQDGFRGGWSQGIEEGVELTRCPLYVPANPTGLKRLVHHISFALSALFPMFTAAVRFKPDIVFTVAPSLISTPVAWLSAKIARSPSWLHIQDFEAEASFATGLLRRNSLIGQVALSVEKKIIKLFDRVSTISPEMCRKLLHYGINPQRVIEFRNWAELESIFPLKQPSGYRRDWNISTRHVALYSGNIANKQGIEIVLDAAKILQHRNDLTFVVCGQGPNRSKIELMARGLSNIRFFDLQPPECLNDLLGLATVHLVPQKGDAADLVLPSKLTNMLASGRPVVATAAAGTGLAREVEGAGLVVPPNDSVEFARAVVQLIENPELWEQLSQGARAKAESVWNRTNIITAFNKQIEKLGAPKKPSI